MSAAAKKAVGERMRRYWAERRKAGGTPAAEGMADTRSTKTVEKPEKAAKTVKPKTKRGTLSAAGRAAISAAQKKRWAAKKRAGKKR
jgi:hypothetical protein